MQNVIISGRSYTGTTTLARSLSESIGWEFVGAGERLRTYCREHGIDITGIPHDVQIQFDCQIKSEILERPTTVFEGRYLGIFSKDISHTLKVLVIASVEVRAERCLEREKLIQSLLDATAYISVRDNQEDADAKALYGIDNYLNASLFDLALENNNLRDLDINVQLLSERLSG